MTTAPVAAADRCAPTSARLAEPLAGTAPVASTWIVVEQPGPWGADALTESHLDPELGRRLQQHVADHPVRVLLARRTGRHPDEHRRGAPRTVWLASTRPGRLGLRRWVVDDPSAVLELDVAALAAGDLPPVGEADPDPLMLVCTNARRDRCCALEGRPAVAAAAAAAPGRAWECSHLGGHRFAPTALLLPHGYVLGRLDPAAAATVVERARVGLLDPSSVRGRSTWSRPAQAAEVEVRRALRLTGLSDVEDATAEQLADGTWRATVRSRRGTHRLVVRPVDGPARPESCGGASVLARSHAAELVGT